MSVWSGWSAVNAERSACAGSHQCAADSKVGGALGYRSQLVGGHCSFGRTSRLGTFMGTDHLHCEKGCDAQSNSMGVYQLKLGITSNSAATVHLTTSTRRNGQQSAALVHGT